MNREKYNTKGTGIYIHVPFCDVKCPYCDFYSVGVNDEIINLYVESLCREIRNKSILCRSNVDTIYFGGGTPSLIGIRNIERIIETIEKNFKLENPEITIEVNPQCHSYFDFFYLYKIGVNRVSIGMQSINEDELKIIGRNHCFADVEKILHNVRIAGIDNVSFDVMIAIPNQTKESLLKTISFCAYNFLPHISVYMLKIEKNTKFFRIKDSLKLPDENLSADYYMFCSEFLTSMGYNHYEISNFAFPGKESRHNNKYWNCDEYLGLGPSAHSFINGYRFYYPRSLGDFMKSPCQIFDGKGGGELEYIMLRLRLREGLNNHKYKKIFGENIPYRYYERAKKFEKLGLVRLCSDGIRLTTAGFLVSNSIISEIIG